MYVTDMCKILRQRLKVLACRPELTDNLTDRLGHILTNYSHLNTALGSETQTLSPP